MTKEEFTKGILEKQRKRKMDKEKRDRIEIESYRQQLFEKNRRKQRRA